MDNPERFLWVNGVNNGDSTPSHLAGEVSAGQGGLNDLVAPSPKPSPVGRGSNDTINPENQLSQNLPPQSLPQPQGNFDMNTLALLLGILQKVSQEKGDKANPDDFIKVIEQIIEQEKNNEV